MRTQTIRWGSYAGGGRHAGMSETERDKLRERVVRTVESNTRGSGPDAIDADHIRVHLCANSGYPVEQVSRAIADALEAGELREVEGGYVVTN